MRQTSYCFHRIPQINTDTVSGLLFLTKPPLNQFTQFSMAPILIWLVVLSDYFISLLYLWQQGSVRITGTNNCLIMYFEVLNHQLCCDISVSADQCSTTLLQTLSPSAVLFSYSMALPLLFTTNTPRARPNLAPPRCLMRTINHLTWSAFLLLSSTFPCAESVFWQGSFAFDLCSH